MARKVWIEVAMNGNWTRKMQPRVPITVDELVADGIACVRAGASILHLHALDPETGRQTDDPATYAAAIEGIKAEVDAIVYPTLPFAPYDGWRHRYEAVEALGERGLLEMSVVDPGSVNIHFVEAKDRTVGGGRIAYVNTYDDVDLGMELAARYGYHPEYACFEPGFIRLGAAVQRARPDAPAPIYSLRFGDQLSFGFPPVEWALDAQLKLLAHEMPGATWMAAAMGGDVVPLVPAIVERGGHVRTGLEDASFGCKYSNAELVDRVVAAVQREGAEPATTAEVRAALSGGGERRQATG